MATERVDVKGRHHQKRKWEKEIEQAEEQKMLDKVKTKK
jgi:hypothetical protein